MDTISRDLPKKQRGMIALSGSVRSELLIRGKDTRNGVGIYRADEIALVEGSDHII